MFHQTQPAGFLPLAQNAYHCTSIDVKCKQRSNGVSMVVGYNKLYMFLYKHSGTVTKCSMLSDANNMHSEHRRYTVV